MSRLKGKVAIVTGAASKRGLGFATASLFAENGAKVVLSDVSEAAVLVRADELVSAGGEAMGVGHDVSREDQWARIIEATIDRYGRLDVLVNNAGVIELADIGTTTLAGWNHVMAINLTGTFLGCQAAVRQFRKQNSGGSIINIGSTSSLRATPGCTAYTASKGAIRSLTKATALDVASEGIRVNAVYPGLMITEMNDTLISEVPEVMTSLTARVPMQRAGAPREIAATSLFLASDDSSYVTGGDFAADGALTAQ